MEIKARVPGMVHELKVAVGDAVKVKDIVAVMEAMKMLQPVPSPVEGTVKSIAVAQGDRVKGGALLMVIE